MNEHVNDRSAEGDLVYPYAPPAPDGSAVEVAPGILWLRMPMPMQLDHINVYCLRDDDGWFIIDTGLPLPETQALWERIRDRYFDGLPVLGVVCTHFHYDHAGCAAWLMETTGASLYMREFVEQPCAVCTDGIRRQRQFPCDITDRLATCEQLEHLHFAVRQAVERAGGCVGAHAEGETFGQFRGDEEVAGGDAGDGVEQQVR